MGTFTLIKYRLKATKNQLVDTIKNHRIKSLFIVGFSISIFLLIHSFFKATYKFFSSFQDLQFDIWFSNTMINGIFFFNLIFIAISATIIAYDVTFKDKNINLLYFSKVSKQAMFTEILLRTAITSSWSFLVLSLPLLLVVYTHFKVNFFSEYILLSAILVAFFLILPNILGICIALLLPIIFTRQTLVKTLTFVLIVATFACLPYLKTLSSNWSILYSEIWITQTLQKFAFLEHPLLPSFWLTQAINGFLEKSYKYDAIFLLVTTSLTLLVYCYVIFTVAYKKLLILSTTYVQLKNPILEALVLLSKKLITCVTKEGKNKFIKDCAIFVRDGRFWGQFLLFVAIFSFYFMNLADSHFRESLQWPLHFKVQWNDLILHLNIIAATFMSSALAGRALYPQFSIEYSKVWFLQFSKKPIEKLINAKMYTIGVLIILLCAVLLTIASIILKTNLIEYLYALFQCILATFTISTIALKLGVIFHYKKSDNPVVIFSGTGGIIYIMVGTFYIVVNAIAMLKIGLFGGYKLGWLLLFVLENILINEILNQATKRIYAKLEYT
jgi:hypothetical protein